MGDKAEITMTFRLWKNTLLKVWSTYNYLLHNRFHFPFPTPPISKGKPWGRFFWRHPIRLSRKLTRKVRITKAFTRCNAPVWAYYVIISRVWRLCDIDGICYLFSPSSFNFHQELDPLKAVDLETTAKVKVPDEITQADENNDMATVSRRKHFTVE